MKKLTCALLAACLMLGILGVTAISAAQTATGEVLVGTPEIDGKVDDIYTKSLTIKSGDYAMEVIAGHNEGWDMTMTATTYVLYDDNYLYIVSDVKDDDIASPADAYMAGANPYRFDGVEYRLCVTEGNSVKVSVDAFGKRCFGMAAHELLFDYSSIKYKTTQSDDGFVIEVAIPREGIFAMPADGTFGIKVQLGDMNAEAAGKTPKEKTNMFTWLPTADGDEGITGPVAYKLSAAATEVTEATTVATEATTVATEATTVATEATTVATEATTVATEATTVATEATTVATEATTVATEATTVATTAADSTDAPATFDVAIIAAVVMAASAGAVVLGKKRH